MLIRILEHQHTLKARFTQVHLSHATTTMGSPSFVFSNSSVVYVSTVSWTLTTPNFHQPQPKYLQFFLFSVCISHHLFLFLLWEYRLSGWSPLALSLQLGDNLGLFIPPHIVHQFLAPHEFLTRPPQLSCLLLKYLLTRLLWDKMGNTWTINEPHLPKNRPRCYVKSPTAQDAFQLIPGLISTAGVTGRWGLLCHAQKCSQVAGLI